MGKVLNALCAQRPGSAAPVAGKSQRADGDGEWAGGCGQGFRLHAMRNRPGPSVEACEGGRRTGDRLCVDIN